MSATTLAVTGTRDLPDGVAVDCGQQSVRAAVVILAAGWASKDLDPFLGDKLYPVRSQLLTLPVPPGRLQRACDAQYGHTFWRQDGAVLVIGGCRWATPHMEAGETDDTVTVERIESRILGFVQQHFPDIPAQTAASRWSGIMAFSCDGLPLIGPIPGRPRFVACAGFGSAQLGLGVRAGQVVAQGLLGHTIEGVPRLFTLGRFVR